MLSNKLDGDMLSMIVKTTSEQLVDKGMYIVKSSSQFEAIHQEFKPYLMGIPCEVVSHIIA